MNRNSLIPPALAWRLQGWGLLWHCHHGTQLPSDLHQLCVCGREYPASVSCAGCSRNVPLCLTSVPCSPLLGTPRALTSSLPVPRAMRQVCTAGSHSSPLHRPQLGGSHLCLSTQESSVPPGPQRASLGEQRTEKTSHGFLPVLLSLAHLRSACSAQYPQPLPLSP